MNSEISQLKYLINKKEIQDFLSKWGKTKFDAIKTSKELQTYPIKTRKLILDYLKLLPKIRTRFKTNEYILCDSLAYAQSTNNDISQYKADKIQANEAVLDLCCGMGSDVFHLKAPNSIVGYDLSDSRLEMAKFNVPLFHKNVLFKKEDVMKAPSNLGSTLIDPDRRATNSKHNWNPNCLSPNIKQIEELLQKHPNCLVKLPPAISPDDFSNSKSFSLEYIGTHRDCRECLLLTGKYNKKATVSSVILPSRKVFTRTLDVINGYRKNFIEDPKFLIEPIKTIIRAQLTPALAEELNLYFLDENLALLGSTTKPHQSPFVQNFQVLAKLPKIQKKIQAALKKYNCGILEIKKRGILLDPEEERKKFKLKGKQNKTLFYTRLNKRPVVYLCERLESQ